MQNENLSHESKESPPGNHGNEAHGSGCAPVFFLTGFTLYSWLHLSAVLWGLWDFSFWLILWSVAATTGAILVCFNLAFPGNPWPTLAKLPAILFVLFLMVCMWEIAFPNRPLPDRPPLFADASDQTPFRPPWEEIAEQQARTAKASEKYWKEAVWPMQRFRLSIGVSPADEPGHESLIGIKAYIRRIAAAENVDTTHVDPQLVEMAKQHLEYDKAFVALVDEVETYLSGQEMPNRLERPIGEILNDLETRVTTSFANDSRSAVSEKLYYQDVLEQLRNYLDVIREVDRVSGRLEERYQEHSFPIVTVDDVTQWQSGP